MTEPTTISPDVQKAHDLAVAATQPETFDFAAAVLDRSYPEVTVPVYLDERSIQKMLEVDRERKALELRIARSSAPQVEHANKLEELDNKFTELVDTLKGQEYVVHIKGIAPERTVELEEETYEKYPREFEEIAHPITGAMVKTEKDIPERNEYWALRIRSEHIVSVTAPNGAVDSDFSDIEKMRATWARLPLVARNKIDEAINEATIAVDFYRELVDEVF